MMNATLKVNKSEDGRVQCNVTTKVNAKAIRRFKHNGRDHIAIPSYTLPSNVVMNGGLYPSSEIDAFYKGLEGTPAPLGHPEMDGKFISARSPEGLNQGWVGAWNRNVKKSGDRVYVEKWVDVEVAARTEQGRELLARVEALEKGEDVPPIHTSVAMFLIEEPAPEGVTEYEWVARIMEMDHDAILLNEVGAATPEQGVGLMVNADKARSLAANAGVLNDTSYRAQERRLEDAARKAFIPEGSSDWVYVADFDETNAIIVKDGGDAEIYGYTVAEGVVTFDAAGTPVQREESWIRRLPGVNTLLQMFNQTRAEPENKPEETDMPLTAEEKAEIIKDVGTTVNQLLTDALAPLTATITSIQANQTVLSESLTANTRQEEIDMRAVVAEKHGEIIANSLKGEDLKKVFKECGTANGLLSGNHSTQKPAGLGVPDAKDHLRA